MTPRVTQAERTRELAKREAVAVERQERTERAEQQPFAIAGESHRAPKEAPRKERTREEELEHQRWVEEKPLRAEQFRQRQEDEHNQAVALAAAQAAAAKRESERSRSAALEAAMHVVPAAPTLDKLMETVGAHLEATQISEATATGEGGVEYSEYLY